jgi:hypothetical protein
VKITLIGGEEKHKENSAYVENQYDQKAKPVLRVPAN